MPIKPENKARYPKDWKAIRTRIVERAGNKCEQCAAPNGVMIARGVGRDAGLYHNAEVGGVYCAETGRFVDDRPASEFEATRCIVVVLTVAHLDHTPENCEPSNLRALCQRCHLRYDHEHHMENARATRRSRNAVADLFGAQPRVTIPHRPHAGQSDVSSVKPAWERRCER